MSIDIGPVNGHISMEDGAESDDGDGSFPVQGRKQGRTVHGVGDIFRRALEVCI